MFSLLQRHSICIRLGPPAFEVIKKNPGFDILVLSKTETLFRYFSLALFFFFWASNVFSEFFYKIVDHFFYSWHCGLSNIIPSKLFMLNAE
jgi:hypothetical protein